MIISESKLRNIIKGVIKEDNRARLNLTEISSDSFIKIYGDTFNSTHYSLFIDIIKDDEDADVYFLIEDAIEMQEGEIIKLSDNFSYICKFPFVASNSKPLMPKLVADNIISYVNYKTR